MPSVDEELTLLLINAHRSLGILEGLIRIMPALPKYSALLSLFEAVQACQMEKTDIALFSLWDNDPKSSEDISKVNAYRTATYCGFSDRNKDQGLLKYFGDIYRTLTGSREDYDLSLL